MEKCSRKFTSDTWLCNTTCQIGAWVPWNWLNTKSHISPLSSPKTHILPSKQRRQMDLRKLKSSRVRAICGVARPSSLSTSFTNQFWNFNLTRKYSVLSKRCPGKILFIPIWACPDFWDNRETSKKQIKTCYKENLWFSLYESEVSHIKTDE